MASDRLLSTEGPSSGSCTQSSSALHNVTIENDIVTPKHTDGKYCETLIITNHDDKVRIIAFGQHARHTAYDGIEEHVLTQGKSLKVRLVKTGEFTFHDHNHDAVSGTFTISR